MSLDTPGRVALVTGGSRGIGAAIAADLHAQGYRVAATSRSATAPEGVLPIACDVTDADSVDVAFSRSSRSLAQSRCWLLMPELPGTDCSPA